VTKKSSFHIGKSSFFIDKLFCIFDAAQFADHIDLDLPGIFHFSLNLLGDLLGHEYGRRIIDHLRLDDDTYLTAGLNGKGLFHSGEGIGDSLKLLETLDIVLQRFTPCSGSYL